jgi:hypothetical protein
MALTLSIVLPVFGLILLGFAIGRTRLMPQPGVAALNNFCLYLAIPALLVRSLQGVDLAKFEPGIMLAFFGGGTAHFIFSMVVGRALFRLPRDDLGVFAGTATYGNLVLIGIPLIYLAFGERGVLPIMLLVAFHPLVFFTLPTLVVEAARSREVRPLRILGGSALALVKHPVMVSMVAGLGLALSGIGFHPLFDRLMALLGQAAAPTALFGLGASLAHYSVRGTLGQVAALSLLKLAVMPAFVYAAAHYVLRLDPLATAIATIGATMPAGVNAFLLAQYYQLNLARAAATVIVSTAGAAVTSAMLLAWFLPRFAN